MPTAVLVPAPALRDASSDWQAQVGAQLTAQYERAVDAERRIAEANLDLVLFGCMLAQVAGALEQSGAPSRGRGAVGLHNWLEQYAPTIDRRRGSELAKLGTSIAERHELSVAELQGLLQAPEDAQLPTGASTTRRKILESLGAGSIHRLHLEYGSRKHGGARVAAERPVVERTLEQRRADSYAELGRMISSLQLHISQENLYVVWLDAQQLDTLADNLDLVSQSLRDRSRTMRAADARAAKP